MNLWHRDSPKWAVLLCGAALVLLASSVIAVDSTRVWTSFGATEDVDSIIRLRYNNGTLYATDTFVNRQAIPDTIYSVAGRLRQVRWMFKYTSSDSAWAEYIITHDRTGDQAAGASWTHWLVLTDSSNSVDSTLEGVKVSVYNSGGSFVGWDLTDGSGVAQFSLDSGAYTFKIYDPGYSADTLVDTTASEGDTTYMEGYDTHTDNTARLWGTVIDMNGDSLYGAVIMAVRNGECKTATANDQVVAPLQLLAETDVNGYFYLDVIKSTEFDNSDCSKYSITASYGGETIFTTRALSISSDFNIADSISARP